MDFGSIIKRAWQIAWNFKTLWVLGLFAGTTGGGWSSGPSAQWNISGEELPANWSWQLGDGSYYLQQWVWIVLGVVLVLFVIAMVFLVLSLAAQGGLVQQVNEVEEGRSVSLGRGWSVGFHYWGRIALMGLLLLLPLFVLIMLIGAAVAASIVIPLTTNSSWAGSIVGLAGLLVILVPASLVLGFLLTNLYTLALRFVVIEDRSATNAIAAAWGAIRHRFKDVFLMWLITFGLGIAFAVAIIVPVGFFGVGIGLSVVLGAWPVAVVVGLALFLLLVVIAAAYNTFTSALWTVFFRRITGREVPQAPPAYVTPPAASYAQPGPPAVGYAPAPDAAPTAGYTSGMPGPPVAGYESPPPPESSAPEMPAPEPPAEPAPPAPPDESGG